MTFSDHWLIVMSYAPVIEIRRRTNPMRKLFMAAAALAAFAFVPVFACTSRKTGFSELHEFNDLTIKRNTMDHTYAVFSGYSRCRPVSQTIINNNSLGNACYIGGFSLDTKQLTVQCTSSNGNPKSADFSESVVRATEELTVQSAITGEAEQHNNSTSSDRNEFSTSTIGTYEGPQLKARLA